MPRPTAKVPKALRVFALHDSFNAQLLSASSQTLERVVESADTDHCRHFRTGMSVLGPLA
jgi:hypothetical protein